MYRPSLLNLTSEMLEMISLKKDLFEGSSSSSNSVRSRKHHKIGCQWGSNTHCSSSTPTSLTFGVLVAKSRVAHIRQFDGTL